MAVNKKAFADRMAEKGGITKKAAFIAVDLFIETLLDCMREDEKVKLNLFGRFERKTVKGRMHRNPKTGEECFVPEHYKIKFTPSEMLADKLGE